MGRLLPIVIREAPPAPGRVVQLAAPSTQGRRAPDTSTARVLAARTHRRAIGEEMPTGPVAMRPDMRLARGSDAPPREPATPTTVVRARATGRDVGGVVPAGPVRVRVERRPGVPVASPAQVLASGAATFSRVRDERRRIEQRTAQPMTTRAVATAGAATANVPQALSTTTTFNAPWAEPRGSEPQATPPIDIPRLTDQVVRAINERIVAQHERMGRAF